MCNRRLRSVFMLLCLCIMVFVIRLCQISFPFLFVQICFLLIWFLISDFSRKMWRFLGNSEVLMSESFYLICPPEIYTGRSYKGMMKQWWAFYGLVSHYTTMEDWMDFILMFNISSSNRNIFLPCLAFSNKKANLIK